MSKQNCKKREGEGERGKRSVLFQSGKEKAFCFGFTSHSPSLSQTHTHLFSFLSISFGFTSHSLHLLPFNVSLFFSSHEYAHNSKFLIFTHLLSTHIRAHVQTLTLTHQHAHTHTHTQAHTFSPKPTHTSLSHELRQQSSLCVCSLLI